MSLYETLLIVHPEKGARLKELVDRFKKVIEAQNGNVGQAEEWGLRDLAYRVAKQSKGYYVLLRYESPAQAVQELERNLKLADDILRYLTVRVEEEAIAADAAPARESSAQGSEKAESGA